MPDFILERTRRKTISIRLESGVVKVSAPLKISESVINEFVKSKARWIATKLNRYREKQGRVSDIDGRRFIMIMGKKIPVEQSYAVKRPKLTDEKLLLPIESAALKSGQTTVAMIKKWYKRYSEPLLRELLDTTASTLSLKYGEFRLTDAKRKWGSCDTNKNIRLNWRLIMLPAALISYVIIHELCHTIELNHSKSFWSLVAQYDKDYKSHVRELKELSVINELFR